ncbi:MAG: hypothetical protein HY241_15480 [Actinobacteria bacterium]|nr:hypothetical protein [Actinomycetota bacterium]
MSSTATPAGATTPDHFPPEIVTMLATARAEIDRHLNSGGRCVLCGEPFPCTRSRLADLALGAP